MASVPEAQFQGKAPSPDSEASSHDFESIGSILRRLFQRKGELEACVTPAFDRELSLDLDAVNDRIDALVEERPA